MQGANLQFYSMNYDRKKFFITGSKVEKNKFEGSFPFLRHLSLFFLISQASFVTSACHCKYFYSCNLWA